MMNAPDSRRAEAIKRLNEKRDFKNHLVVYAIVNLLLITIWAATGAGYFWPIWPIGGWGVGLALHGFGLYQQRGFTEDDIRDEMRVDDE